MEEPEGILCETDISAAGLPMRTQAAMDAEVGQVEFALAQLTQANLMQGETPRQVTTRELHAALASGQWSHVKAAAFLIGRCRAQDDAADARLTDALAAALPRLKDPSERTEAAMSLGLRGRTQEAVTVLRQTMKEKPVHEPWTAAAYLAQLGDPSGWPWLLHTLEHDDFAQYRLGALRAVPAFAPLAGARTPGRTGAEGEVVVDPHAAVASRLDDSDATLRSNVPQLLVAVGHPERRRLLEALAAEDADDWVRDQAARALATMRPH